MHVGHHPSPIYIHYYSCRPLPIWRWAVVSGETQFLNSNSKTGVQDPPCKSILNAWGTHTSVCGLFHPQRGSESSCNNSAKTLVILFSLKTMESLQIEVATHFQVIPLLPPANEVCEGYVFTRVCLSMGDGGRYPPQKVHPPGRYTPRSSACWEIRATSGRYASYWNAFLFSMRTESLGHRGVFAALTLSFVWTGPCDAAFPLRLGNRRESGMHEHVESLLLRLISHLGDSSLFPLYYFQWRTQWGGDGDTRVTSTPSPIYFIFIQFSAKILSNNRLAQSLRLGLAPLPPLGSPGSATDLYVLCMIY